MTGVTNLALLACYTTLTTRCELDHTMRESADNVPKDCWLEGKGDTRVNMLHIGDRARPERRVASKYQELRRHFDM